MPLPRVDLRRERFERQIMQKSPTRKIVFDAKNFYSLTGVPNYISGLIRAIHEARPEIEFHAIGQRRYDLGEISAFCSWRTEQIGFLQKIKPNLWLKLFAHRLIQSDEVFLAGATLVPLFLRNNKIFSIAYDLNHLLVPQTMSFGNRWTQRIFFKRDLANAQYRLCISQGTRNRLKKHLGIEAEGVLLPSPIRLDLVSSDEYKAIIKSLGLEKFILFVGTLEPRKNLRLLLQIFPKLRAIHPEIELVIVGGKGWKMNGTQSMPTGVRVLGFVDHRTLVALYQSCSCFVLPSIYEGFGMPVLEARLLGAQTACTDLPEMREAGGEETIYFKPTPEAILEGLQKALATNRKQNYSVHHDQTLPTNLMTWLDEI